MSFNVLFRANSYKLGHLINSLRPARTQREIHIFDSSPVANLGTSPKKIVASDYLNNDVEFK
jgi:hypothetical protein